MQRVLASRAVVVPGVQQEIDQERESQTPDRESNGDEQSKLRRRTVRGQIAASARLLPVQDAE